MDTVLFAIWFFLPAGFANTVPIIAARLPYLRDLNQPMDMGRKFRGKRIFGTHKTWRGLAVGILAAIIAVYVQQQLADSSEYSFLERDSASYLDESALLLGFLFGMGALGGDAIKSFIKRQAGIPAGQTWFPFDQLDYIIGTCLILSPIVILSFAEYTCVILFWFLTHLLFSYIGYKLNFKQRPI